MFIPKVQNKIYIFYSLNQLKSDVMTNYNLQTIFFTKQGFESDFFAGFDEEEAVASADSAAQVV